MVCEQVFDNGALELLGAAVDGLFEVIALDAVEFGALGATVVRIAVLIVEHIALELEIGVVALAGECSGIDLLRVMMWSLPDASITEKTSQLKAPVWSPAMVSTAVIAKVWTCFLVFLTESLDSP